MSLAGRSLTLLLDAGGGGVLLQSDSWVGVGWLPSCSPGRCTKGVCVRKDWLESSWVRLSVVESRGVFSGYRGACYTHPTWPVPEVP